MPSVLAVFFFKGTSPQTKMARRRGINISGVDFWHAVEFSRNGSFLRDRFTGPSGLSLRCLQPYQIRFAFPLFVSGPLLERGFCFAPSGVSTTLADSLRDS